MRERKEGPLSEFVSKQTNLIRILIVAFLAAFGINLAAGSLLFIATVIPLYARLLIGIGIAVSAVLYLVMSIYAKRTQIRAYKGLFVHDLRKNEVIKIPRYYFSESMVRYLKAAFIENQALKVIWDRQPLKHMLEFDLKDDSDVPVVTSEGSRELIREVVEYFVLNQFSTHLDDYFNDERFRQENLAYIGRKDIPEILLTNRFLELFSRPMRDRIAFSKDSTWKENSNETPDDRIGMTVASYRPSGEIYERFTLVTPKGTIISRPNKNTIEIRTKMFTIHIKTDFRGSLTILPSGFEHYYLSLDSDIRSGIYAIDVEVRVSFGLGLQLPGTGRQYYRWVDSFLDTLNDNISASRFFESIGWNTAMTVIQCLAKSTMKSTRRKRTT